MSKIVLVLLLTIFSKSLGQSAFLSDKSTQCYDKECPSTTTACKKLIDTSEDKRYINTVIQCLDAQNMVLKDYNESKENVFGPGTTFHSESFSGTYTSHGGEPINVNINNINPINDNNIEDFV